MVNLFAVLGIGPGWGCVSQYGNSIREQCKNTTLPADPTNISEMGHCR